MSIYDVLLGRKPLLKSTQIKRNIREIEQEFVSLMNREPNDKNYHFKPAPSRSVAVADAIAEDTKPVIVSGRYTLNPAIRTKILDTQGKAMDVYITVPNQGQVAYACHDATRVLSRAGGLHEGIPLTNNPAVAGRPTANHLKWVGELWLSGDTVGMVVDVEAS